MPQINSQQTDRIFRNGFYQILFSIKYHFNLFNKAELISKDVQL